MLPPAGTRDAFVREHANGTVLVVVRACAPVAAIIMSAYAVASVVVHPDQPIISCLDAAVTVALFLIALLSRRARLPASWAEGASTVVVGTVAVTSVLRLALAGEPICAVHVVTEMFALASVLVTRRWFYPFLLTTTLGFLAAAGHWMAGSELAEHALGVVSAAAVASLVFEARRRALISYAHLLWHDEGVRADLRSALATAQLDLVERQRAEAERETLREQLMHSQKLEAIGTLAGGIAHDMNNVLASISVLAEVMCEDLPADSPHRSDTADILSAAKRGADLTRNLLAFGRKGKYREEDVPLNTVVRDVEQLLVRTLRKETRVEVVAAEGRLAAIGDPSQLTHALLNICINASDAMDGAGTIRIVTERATLSDKDVARLGLAPAPYVVVRVEDHGCGMDEETRRRAFEPFFTTKPVGRGTGLGLSMVYGTMQSHKGAVEIESKIGAGTTLSLYLPAAGAAADARSPPAPVMTRAQHGTVLVVDDEPLVRSTTNRAMTRLGYHVVLADGGQAALDIIAKDPHAIDLVLLDMAMPGMGGAECFHKLRVIAPTMKVVICSGYALSFETEELLRSGASGFIEKPYSVRELSDLVRQVLARPARGAATLRRASVG